MADLGGIGDNYGSEPYLGSGLMPSVVLTSLCFDSVDYQVMGAITWGTEKVMRVDNIGFICVEWQVKAGVNRMSVQVMQAINLAPRPSVEILPVESLGVPASMTVAGSSTDWVKISVSVTSTGLGVVRVKLWDNLKTQLGRYPCYWRRLDLGVGGIPWNYRVVSPEQPHLRQPH